MRNLTTLACTALTIACSGQPGPYAASNAINTVPAPAAAPGARPAAPGGTSSGAQAVGDFVRSRTAQLQFCYEDTRDKNPKLAGTTTVAVNLTPDGNVVSADVLRRSWSGKGSDKVEKCMLSTVRGWKFPPAGDGAQHMHSFSVVFTR